MMKDISRSLVGWILVMACAGGILYRPLEPADAIPAQARSGVIRTECAIKATASCSPELSSFFGRAKPDGSMVTDEEFHAFLDAIVTPRFPNGLTAAHHPA